jgi:hypothetical protein
MASHSRWTWLPYRRKPKRTDGDGIDRRTVLVGAAATAGVVAASATPSMAAPASTATTAAAAMPATNLALAQTPPDTIPASQVTYVPTGEITDTDVQSVLSTMDQRLSKVQLFDDLQVAMTLVDDFMGNTSTSGTIGQLGWALPTGSTGTAAVATAASEPGIFVLGTGTTSSGWSGINLGTNTLIGAPVLMCEWRVKLTQLNNGSDKYSLWFGLHNAISGSEPTTGIYFRYTPTDTQWFAACADGGAPNAVATNVAADTNFHRFRLTADGAGVARFYIDDAQVALVTSPLPSTNTYAPNLIIRKNVGTTARNARVDYFALRYEHAR